MTLKLLSSSLIILTQTSSCGGNMLFDFTSAHKCVGVLLTAENIGIMKKKDLFSDKLP